ncbi:hypothetical protein [Roseateles amylovorans]|uniref:HEPN domain-containing protein n=1 Tax=Roseateles amylovorans TaxID=2978473 RepID=A0ABY6B4B2_9BURK|nr:hypothetical protein [Roseateles amylovorans]UXH79774.1 hypothetical protein N4261_07750 [Roseateles amylovorans]
MTCFDPEGFLSVAERLLAHPDEASARSAASRAYYSAFLMARDRSGVHHRGSAIHAKVQNHLRAHGEVWLAQNLQRLRACRNLADYQVHRRFQSRRARWATEIAKDIQVMLRAMDVNGPSHWRAPAFRGRH